jgi:predicted acylesterase/phospholipase RssA
VSVEIEPEPTPEQREALLKALAALDRGGGGASAWWEAGIREALEGERES